MPSHRVHEFMSRVFLGKGYRKIHRSMDSAYAVLGRSHRVLFHDVQSCYLIATAEYPNDPNAISAALLHIELDELCSFNPGYRRYLEKMAELEAEERRRKRKKRRKRRTRRTRRRRTDGEFEEFCLKIMKLKSYARILFGR